MLECSSALALGAGGGGFGTSPNGWSVGNILEIYIIHVHVWTATQILKARLHTCTPFERDCFKSKSESMQYYTQFLLGNGGIGGRIVGMEA